MYYDHATLFIAVWTAILWLLLLISWTALPFSPHLISVFLESICLHFYVHITNSTPCTPLVVYLFHKIKCMRCSIGFNLTKSDMLQFEQTALKACYGSCLSIFRHYQPFLSVLEHLFTGSHLLIFYSPTAFWVMLGMRWIFWDLSCLSIYLF